MIITNIESINEPVVHDAVALASMYDKKCPFENYRIAPDGYAITFKGKKTIENIKRIIADLRGKELSEVDVRPFVDYEYIHLRNVGCCEITMIYSED